MHLKLVTHILAVALVSAHIKDYRAPSAAAAALNDTRQGVFEWIGNIFNPFRPESSTSTTTTTSPQPQRKCKKCQCGRINTYKRIVGGQETQVNEYPWMAMLLRGNSFYCGATLINDLYVATAAHCLRNIDKRYINVRLLLHGKSDTHGVINRHAAAVMWHEQYSSRTLDNDIGLIRLSEPVKWSHKLRPVCMPAERNSFTGYNATVTGWGALSEAGPVSGTLQEVVVPIISQSKCRSSNYSASDITDNMLCAGYVEGGKDSCQGDSGGPLVLTDDDDDYYQLAGIVSWGVGCARPNTPGVYTRVNRYLNWIAKRTTDGCSCDKDYDDSEEGGTGGGSGDGGEGGGSTGEGGGGTGGSNGEGGGSTGEGTGGNGEGGGGTGEGTGGNGEGGGTSEGAGGTGESEGGTGEGSGGTGDGSGGAVDPGSEAGGPGGPVDGGHGEIGSNGESGGSGGSGGAYGNETELAG